MDLNQRDGWVIRQDLTGVEYVRGLALDEMVRAGTPRHRASYHRPDGVALVPGTELYRSEMDALDALVRLLPLQIGLLEREVTRLLDQAARTRELVATLEAKRDEAEARRDQLLRKGWG
jgi:hypothetical protein